MPTKVSEVALKIRMLSVIHDISMHTISIDGNCLYSCCLYKNLKIKIKIKNQMSKRLKLIPTL
jgi:hypothetical protein